MSICLNCLLKCPHLLDFHQLSAPLNLKLFPLFTFNFQLFTHLLFLLLKVCNLLLKFFNLLICECLSCFTLEAIDCLKQSIWVFDFMLDQWPKLLEKSTQIFRFFFGFFKFLVEKLLTIPQQRYKFLVFCFQHFYFFDVRTLLGILGRLSLRIEVQVALCGWSLSVAG